MFVCKLCGYIHFEDKAPDKCPVCHATSFNKDDSIINMPADFENMTEAEKKHHPVIVIQESRDGVVVNVRVGEIEHPMEKEHWIVFIDIYVNGKYESRNSFAPGSSFAPIVEHIGDNIDGEIKAVANCNKHGYWVSTYNKPKEEGTYVCKNCGMKSDKSQHLCSPVKKDEKFTCEYCGIKTDDIRHICQKKVESIKYSCETCGRVTNDGESLCSPKEIK